MVADLKDTFFTQNGRYFNLTEIKKNNILPFKDHSQFPVLGDILSRKSNHHVILCADFPPSLQTTFIESFLHYLAREHVPYSLREAEFIFLHLEHTLLTEIKQLSFEKDFEALREMLDKTDKYLVVILNRIELFSKDTKRLDDRFLRKQIELLLAHPNCRAILFTNPKEYSQHLSLEEQFTYLSVPAPCENDIMTILKQQKNELENFHKILIPDELLAQAFLLAERYLSTSRALEKTLLLLDSSAARTGSGELKADVNSFKPVLTSSILLNVLSDWTQIPATHLQINKFKHNEFVQNLQQHIFGQETAITILGHELLQAQARLQPKTGAFCSFLFAGPAHSGKKTLALALTEQLFKQLNVLFFAQMPLAHHTLADIKLQRCLDKQFFSLTDVIKQTPYAVILFENIEKYSSSVMEGLQEVLTTGYLHDIQGNQHNFRQSIVILSTTVGTNSLNEYAEEITPEEDNYTMDLMQLVLNDQKNETTHESHHYSAQEIIEKIMPDITEVFSLSLCQNLHLVPFLPLSKSAVEKIIRLKLKTLGKQLNARYNIELGYAPEVIRFLTHEVLAQKTTSNSINTEKALKQLYFCVEQAVLNQVENKNHSNQLFLQLNETGHLLRCDWLPMAAVRQHAN